MFKISYSNGLWYLIIKYTVFFIYLAFLGNRFKNIVINNAQTSAELMRLSFGYVLQVFLFMLLLVLIFSIPFYFIMRLKSKIYLVLAMIAFFSIEYFVYTYLASPSEAMLGIYNLIIGVVVFIIIYQKSITQIFK
ncbi:MAG: hypothetical protein RLZZ262_412 [Bacteroidota bacterium]|jgi:hypothetical protein